MLEESNRGAKRGEEYERTEAKSSEPISLWAAETLPQLVARTATERTGGDQVAAYRLVATSFPVLVEAWASGDALR